MKVWLSFLIWWLLLTIMIIIAIVSAEQPVRICALLTHSDGLRNFATLLSLFNNCGVAFFSLFVLLPPHKPQWGFPPQTGKSTPLSLSWWITESQLDNRSLFEEATCVHLPRVGFTWLDESLHAHPGCFFFFVCVQPIKPGHTCYRLAERGLVFFGWQNPTLV